MRRRRRTLCCKIVFCEKSNSNKEGTTMSKDNVISLKNPEGNADVFTDLLRSGARELIKKAVQTELAEFLSQYEDMTGSEGRPLVVRNGYLPERELMTGIGPVDIKVPKTRDRGGQGIHFIRATTTIYQTHQYRRNGSALALPQRNFYRRLSDVINGVKFIEWYR
jgi:hypothetical protein